MNNSQEILDELRLISPLMAGLEKVNAFQVPDGYFDNLSDRLSNFAIFNTRNELDLNKTNVHQVPEGYFDTLSTDILAKIKKLYPETADEELRNLSPMLYSLKKENVFKIPDGYFDSLSTNILAKNKKLYLETTEEELRNLSPMLYSVKNENVFKVPDGYFENFANDVIKKVKPVSAKIVAMKPRNTWMRIAAAAVVTGIIAISSLQIFNNSSKQDNPKIVITAWAEIPGYVKESLQFKTEQQLDAGIVKLSDDDIIKYLEKNGSLLDNDLLLKNTDISELPAQADYLNDQNTLNSYLDKIDQKGNSN